LAKAGLPLSGGFRALAEELSPGRLSGVLRRMAGRLDSGAALDEAIEAEGPRFPAHLRGLVIAAVRSGHLAEVLEEFVDLNRIRSQLRRRLWAALAYPMVLMSMAAALFTFLQLVIAGQFIEVFEDFDAELPAMTRLFLESSGSGMWIIECAVSLLMALVLLSLATPVVPWAARMMYLVPLVGPLWRFSRLAEFSRLMGLLLDERVPLGEALRLTAAALREADLAAACRRVAEEVEQGRPLAESLASRRQFPPTLIPLVEWGQRGSALPDAFRASAEMFEGRVQTQGSLLEVVVAPIAFILILMFVMAFVIAMFLPMISLIQTLT